MHGPDPIQACRDSGDAAGALERLLEVLHEDTQDDGRRIEAWQRHIAGPQCLVLDVARAGRGSPAETLRLLDDFQRDDWVRYFVPASLLEARVVCLRAALGVTDSSLATDADRDQLAALIRRAVDRYAEGRSAERCPYKTSAALAQLSSRLTRRPAFLAALNPGWIELFQRLAGEDQAGWLHPGLLLAGETVAYVWSEPLADEHGTIHTRLNANRGPHSAPAPLPADAVVQTWILLAENSSTDPSRPAPPGGVLARLTVERVPGGCGGLYPHPQRAGYLQAVDTFQIGLQNALYAVLHHELPNCGYDFRWSLEAARPSEPFSIGLRITGRSAEAAVGCAIRALLNGERLDQHVAVTAQLQYPGHPGDKRLTAVASIDDKLLAPGVRMHHDLLAKQIDEVLVAADQPEVTGNGTAPAQRTKIGNGEVQLVPVRDLDQAYQHLASGPRWTDAVRKKLAERADQILQERCGTYVRSALSKEDARPQEGPSPSGLGFTHTQHC